MSNNEATKPETNAAVANQVDALVMHLTPAEVTVIKSRRKAEAARDLAKDLHKVAMLLVNNWTNYQDETGMMLTWSIFLDDFDCDKIIPMDLQQHKKLLYSVVEEVSAASKSKCMEYTGA